MRHWVSMLDWTPPELAELVSAARRAKTGDASVGAALRGRIAVMVFFNPSLRTRASCEAAMLRNGGHAIALDVGGNTWKLEYRDGAAMTGDAAEHIREAAPVLSRYGDLLAVRTFAALKDAAADAEDAVIRAFARHATVPVVNLESAMEHPCQGLADWMTVDERLGGARGRRFTVTWAPQVKGLPL
ncbi:MAG: acetylornithine carbamoyltransferase, partial [Planctomycetota bacterium]